MIDVDPDCNYYNEVINENNIFSSFDSVEDFLSGNSIEVGNSNYITIFSQNIRSMSRNLDNFLCLFPETKMSDIFIFSETWHDTNTPVIKPGYEAYHTIRQGRSGGVSIFVKFNIESCFIQELSFTSDSIETCIIRVSSSQNNMYICGIYRPHIGTVENFTSSLENILNSALFAGSTCVVAGDFNINLLVESRDVDSFTNMMRSHHYLQTITGITHPGVNQSTSSLIDHVWINCLCNYNCGILRTGITDHYTLFIQLPFRSEKPSSNNIEIKFRDFNFAYQQFLKKIYGILTGKPSSLLT